MQLLEFGILLHYGQTQVFQCFFLFCFSHSPAGRRCAAANWGTEAEGGGSHRAVATYPGTAGTQTQLDSTERRDMREPQQKKNHLVNVCQHFLTMKSDASDAHFSHTQTNAIPRDSTTWNDSHNSFCCWAIVHIYCRCQTNYTAAV